jgi:hypothetical protein
VSTNMNRRVVSHLITPREWMALVAQTAWA